jgi:hypothetical protein
MFPPTAVRYILTSVFGSTRCPKMQVRDLRMLLCGNLEFFILRILLYLPLLECSNYCLLGSDIVWFGRNLLISWINKLSSSSEKHLSEVKTPDKCWRETIRWIEAALLLSSEIVIANWRKKNNKEPDNFCSEVFLKCKI